MLDGRERRRRVVELGAGGDDVDAAGLGVEHDGRAEFLVRPHATVERLRESRRQLDRVALDGDVDVEALLREQDVAHGAPDEVDALVALAECGDRLEGRGELLEPLQLGQQVRAGLTLALRGLAQGPEHVAARDDAEHPVALHDRDPPLDLDEPLHLGERSAPVTAGDARAHDPLDWSVREPVADGFVQVLPRHDADQAVVLEYEDPALAVALAGDHRVRDGLVGADAPGRRGHDVAGRDRDGGDPEALVQPRPGLRETGAEDRRSRLPVPAAAERAGQLRRVDLGRAAAHDREHALLHLDEHDEGTAVGQVDDLVCEVGDAVDVYRPLDRADQHLDSGCLDALEPVEERGEQLALGLAERRVQVRGDQLLPGAMTEAPAQRLRVALGRARVGERARVLVDAERERRRLDLRHLDLALGQDADERRRQRPVLRDHGALRRDPVGKLAVRVVVENDLVDRGVERDAFELVQACGVDGLDHDQPADRVRLEPRGLDELELVRMQARELAHVAVQ